MIIKIKLTQLGDGKWMARSMGPESIKNQRGFGSTEKEAIKYSVGHVLDELARNVLAGTATYEAPEDLTFEVVR